APTEGNASPLQGSRAAPPNLGSTHMEATSMFQPKLRSTVAAVMLLAPMAASFLAAPAQAAPATVTRPAITNMALNSDAGLSPGATLRVEVIATPNARRASLTLGDSGISVPLRQAAPGKYTGSHVL